MLFPNSEILFDFNEGSSGVFRIHMMFELVRGALPPEVVDRFRSYVFYMFFEN